MDRSGSAQRWDWLVARVPGLQRSLRRGIDAHDAEDIAQEAILRAALATRAVPPGPEGVAWLHRIARNIAVDRWRRARRVVPLDIASHITVGSEASDGRIDIEVALKRLRPSDRRLLGQIAGGARYSELARAEGVEASVIRQRVARARARILATLKEGS
jgi:RNA polymerase sigma factor (sigma-70 family)